MSGDKITNFFDRIREIYSEIDKLTYGRLGTDNPCGKCYACCSSSYLLPVTSMEIDFIGHVLGNYDKKEFIAYLNGDIPGEKKCPNYDDAANGCKIYDSRPLACRTFGFYPLGFAVIQDECCYKNFQNPQWASMETLVSEFMELTLSFYIHNKDFVPSTVTDFMTLGELALRAGDKEAAVDFYEKAASIYEKKQHIERYINAKSFALSAKDDFVGCEREYEKLFALVEPDSESLYNAAVIKFNLGKFEEAEAYLKKVTAIKEEPKAYYMMGLCRASFGDPIAAEYYDKALSLPGANTYKILRSKALLLENTGKYNDAIEILTGILEKNHQDLSVLLSLISVSQKAGMKGKEIIYCEQLLKIDSEHKPIFEDYYKSLISSQI